MLKTIKKVIAVIVIVVITFAFSSCNNTNKNETQSSSQTISNKALIDFSFDLLSVRQSLEKLNSDKVNNNKAFTRNVISSYSDSMDNFLSKNIVSKWEWIKLFIDVFDLENEVKKNTNDTFVCDSYFELAKSKDMFISDDFPDNPYEPILKKDAADTIVLYLEYDFRPYETSDDEETMSFQTNLQTCLYYHFFEVDKDGYSYPRRYVNYLEYLHVKDEMRKVNTFMGKSALGIGDSIMAGHGNHGNGITELLQDKYKMMAYDYGEGGAAFGYEDEERPQIYKQIGQAKDVRVNPDVILICGGINDLKLNNKGVISDFRNLDINTINNKTYAGGFEWTLGSSKKVYKDIPCLYIREHNAKEYSEELQQEYANLGLTICDKWGVPYVDLYKRSGFSRDENLINEYTRIIDEEEYGDSIHPNNEMYMIYYLPCITDKMMEVINH